MIIQLNKAMVANNKMKEFKNLIQLKQMITHPNTIYQVLIIKINNRIKTQIQIFKIQVSYQVTLNIYYILN